MKKGIVIHAGDEVFHIRKFLTATEINDVLEEFYDFFGYDIIPIAETDSDDYMCLYYKKNRECPSVIYWDYELALINSEEAIFFLYDTMYELEEELR